ncbi:MAG: M10 family metallopeptidase [Pseudomonadota bacterium]
MATPTTNFVPFSFVSPGDTGEARYLVEGTKWGGGLGQGVELTYSFPSGDIAYFLSIYGDSEPDSWVALNQAERTAVERALEDWADVADIDFVRVSDNQSTVGELRFAFSEAVDFADAYAYAYFPWSDPEAGDVWFSYDFNTTSPNSVPRGGYDYLTMSHEIGHALGLKHPFESPNKIPNKFDNFFYTIMSYTASPWSDDGDNFATFYPTTPMFYDYLAIQALYGAEPRNKHGDTVYRYEQGEHYWETIYDTGGDDKIVFQGSRDTEINLNPGRFSALSDTIEFNGGKSRETLTIGPDVEIEDAKGGRGDDKLIGNGLNNVLEGMDGKDVLYGRGGNDRLIGGKQGDRLLGESGNDVLNGGAGKDVMRGGGGRDRFDFDSPSDSGTGRKADDIIGFSRSQDDVIDVRDVARGKLDFIRGKKFSDKGDGEVRIDDKGRDVTVKIDVNGDGRTDMAIDVEGVGKLTAGDFLL